jgi:transcriptional regulator with XRE-family HTH domain
MFAILNIFPYICPEIITLFAMKRQLLPSYSRMLGSMGEQIKLARLRRDLSSEQVAERAGIARGTLIKVEKGDEGVSMGVYFRVLIALGLGQDILLLAKDDELGRKLQDAKLVVKERASKK